MSNLGGAGGAEYEFITQDHATSIQMKLARRACLERNISRCPDFICLKRRYVISSSKNAPRAARAEKCRRASLAPRRAGGDITRDTQHKCTIKINRVCDHTGRTRSAAGPSTVERRGRGSSPQLSFYNVCGKAAESPRSSCRARSRQKAPDPLHERGFHL